MRVIIAYAPNFVEYVFSEVRLDGVVGSPRPRSPDPSVGFSGSLAYVSSNGVVRRGGTNVEEQHDPRDVDDLPPGLAKPARRALAGAGYSRLEQFTEVSEKELLRLHGMGPKALDGLRRTLAAKGLSFADG
jgi:hypothetical protein